MTKILCLADLHITCKCSDQIFQIKNILKNYPDIEVIIIAGDIFDSKNFNTFKELDKISNDGKIPIVFCLGNHEFAYSSVSMTLFNYSKDPDNEKYKFLHGKYCLDVCGHFCYKNINFIGNVLWYDGSLKNLKNQNDEILPNWLDSTISNFNFKLENKKCVKQLCNLKNYPEYNDNNGKFSKYKNTKITKNILITHCVPIKELNAFSYDSISPYNMYSGMNNLFNLLPKKVDYAICGHTHRFAKYITKDNCVCINVGNDYIFKESSLKYYIIEVE